jgi:hypothetical protein
MMMWLDAPGGGGSDGTGGETAFPDAGAARTFLKDYVNDEAVLGSVKDDKVIPWATHVKSKVEGYSKQFPESWRQLIAGDNADHLKTLERFQSPKALYDSYGALRQKMAAGQLKEITPFPEKGSDEEKNNWRAANGVPLTQEEYGKALRLPQGVALGEDDKPTVESFAQAAHAAHMPPALFNATVGWFLQEKGNRASARAEKDSTQSIETEDALRAEWQNDYRGNINRITSFLDGAPKGVKDMVMNARYNDGTALMNHPDTLRWLVDLARQTNPAGVVLPGSGGNIGQSIADELKAIDTLMKTDRGTYNKDEAKQARYRDLLAAYQKTTGKTWGQV